MHIHIIIEIDPVLLDIVTSVFSRPFGKTTMPANMGSIPKTYHLNINVDIIKGIL